MNDAVKKLLVQILKLFVAAVAGAVGGITTGCAFVPVL